MTPAALRIGVDLGGTKIAAAAVDADGRITLERRMMTPRNDYAGTIAAIAALIAEVEHETGRAAGVGIGMPGSVSPATGRVQNANSTWLNGQPLQADLERALGRPVRLANDANCFALSEARGGAADGARCVFGVILGTGCGGGIVIDGRIVDGPRGIGGEWGHAPLPWAQPGEYPGPMCWCGRRGCMETWVSGTALAADHARMTGVVMPAETIAAAALAGDASAQASLDRHVSRLARGLAMVVNTIDPDVVVLGGGLSRLPHLYTELPARILPLLFTDAPSIDVRPPRFGDASGVRGAAWLWP